MHGALLGVWPMGSGCGACAHTRADPRGNHAGVGRGCAAAQRGVVRRGVSGANRLTVAITAHLLAQRQPFP
jgi:hypothetical protein